MAELPKTLEEAIAQASDATKAAMAAGNKRIQVELVFPEIGLRSQYIAEQFIPVFEEFVANLNNFKVFFPDAGAAALARRDWGEIPFKINDVGTSRSILDDKIEAEDEAFLFIAPSAAEVANIEKLCQMAGDRPVVFLNPHLEDAATIGIGYTGRKLRERFLNLFESFYYVRPLEGAAVFRCYPSAWQIWLEQGDDYQLITELPKRPYGEEIDQILNKATQPTDSGDAPKPKKGNLFTDLRRFLRALTS